MYKGLKVFDVHGHESSPAGSKVLAAQLIATPNSSRSPLATGRGFGSFSEEQYQAAIQRHAAYMDARDIDVQVIGPRPWMMLGNALSPRAMGVWCEHTNATIALHMKWHPERFLGVCMLPQDGTAVDSTHMIETLETCVRDLGFVATYVSPDPEGRRQTPGMQEPYWYPLYEKCVELSVPIIVHGTNNADDRLWPVPSAYQLGFTTEEYYARMLLSHSDVFDRYPDLQVIICHAGGALNRFIKSDHHLSQKDLSNNLFFDSNAYEVDYLATAIKQHGVSQIAFGTEAPGSGGAVRHEGEGPGKTSDDLIPVIDSFDWLSDEEKLSITNATPAKLIPAFTKV